MAIDATTIDSSAVHRPAPREKASAVIDGGHNGGPVEIRGEMSFWDFLDIINPLQHIPIVSTIYREITGDTIQPSMRIMGGILYGGAIGGMASIANAVIEQSTGKDVGDTVMASLGFGGGDHPATPTAVADASGGPVKSGSPADPLRNEPNKAAEGSSPAGGLAAALAAAGQPVKLSASGPAPAAEASPALVAQLSGGGAVPHPSKMPARDTPLASSALAKHSVPRNAAPVPGSVMAAARAAGAAPASGDQGAAVQSANAQAANAQPANTAGDAAMAAGPVPVSPDMLSETMMRNLAKYEQSRRAAQSAAGTMRVSG